MSEVTLRPLVEADAPELYALVDRNRADLKKFWWEEQTQGPGDSLDFIRAVNAAEVYNGAPTRAICVRQKLGGVAALHTIDWHRKSALLGYWIDRDLSGHGYTTEAVKLLAQEAFEQLGLNELGITPRATNLGSRAIAEHVGFVLTDIRPEPTWRTDEHVDTAFYTLRRNMYMTSK